MRKWKTGERREQKIQEEGVEQGESREAIGPQVQIMMKKIDEGDEDEEEWREDPRSWMWRSDSRTSPLCLKKCQHRRRDIRLERTSELFMRQTCKGKCSKDKGHSREEQ